MSRFALTSRLADADNAWRIEVDGGKPRAATPAQHARGTQVEVRDLFYNVPARRKFLRAERTEFGHVDELVKAIALAHPAIEFRFAHNGKAVRMLKPVRDDDDRARRVADDDREGRVAHAQLGTPARRETREEDPPLVGLAVPVGVAREQHIRST